MQQEINSFLSSYLTEQRRELLYKVISQRTRYLTVVLENIFQSQNAGAVLRTCDCFGIQDVHIIENTNRFEVNRDVVRGATKWLNLHHYNQDTNNTRTALSALKANGYRVIATSPHSNDVNLEDFDIAAGRTALVFGTEMKGISNEVREMADGFLKIPMSGFTESFNVSVSAAIILHHLTFRLKQLNIPYLLSPDEQDEVLYEWLRKSVKSADLMVNTFFGKK
jgi:tRNA (guanosine-2'-O-)-methyltransferase